MAYNKTPFKMTGKSPIVKALVGKQGNLPDALKEKILASPAKQMSKDTIRITKPTNFKLKKDNYIDEDDFDNQFDKVEGDASTFPQDSVQDYSKLKKNKKGFYVTKLKEGEVETPAKQMSKLKKSSPAKQTDVELRDLPDMAVQGAKKLVKKIGSIKLSTKEGQERRKQKKALKAKQKAEKLEAKAKKLKEKTPAKKKGCGYKK